MLLPPTLHSVRQSKLPLTSRKPSSRREGKKRRTPRNQRVPKSCTTTSEGWAVSQNHQNGIYCATKILDPEEVCTYDDVENTDSKPSASNEGNERISQLEKELEELKRTLQLQLHGDSHLPVPELGKPSVSTHSQPHLHSASTPMISSAAELVVIPPPDFNKQATPKEQHVIPPLPPPPPPPVQASKPLRKILTRSTQAAPIPEEPANLQMALSRIFQSSNSMPILRKSEITRSPGGTPLRQKGTDNFLAQALEKKFQKAKPKFKSGKENSPLASRSFKAPKIPSENLVADSEWDMSPVRV